MYKNCSTIELQGRGGNARNLNIAACDEFARRREHKIAKIICGKLLCNRLKRKSLVTSGFSTNTPLSPWRKAYQKLGSSEKKYHARVVSWQVRPALQIQNFDHISRCVASVTAETSITRPNWAPQHGCRPQSAARVLEHWLGQDSAKDVSRDVRGQPTITRNTSRTKSAIAMSLKSVARGESGQS